MTAPQMALQTLPVQWALDNLVLGALDVSNCWWIVRTSDGWYGAPKPRTARTVKAQASGSFRTAAFRNERVIMLSGSTKCPNVVERDAAMDRFAACAAQPYRLYPLTVTDGLGSRTIDVELDDRPDIKKVGGSRWFDWQLHLAAPDPLKYSWEWQRPTSGMVSEGNSGLDFSGTGLDFGGAGAGTGLDFGTPGTGLASQVANFGTARTFPLFSIRGPAITPQVTDLDTGEVVAYAGTLYEGDTLTINCAEFAAYGFPPRSCYLNTYADQRVLLSVPAVWPSVGPGEVRTYQLAAAGVSTATITVYLRSAWY